MNEFINLDKDKILGNKQCSVNKRGIHSNLDVKVYRCKCSVDEDILICLDCKNTCHKDHQTEPSQKMKAKDFICSCAKSGHNPNKDKNQNNENLLEENNIQNAKEVTCNMIKYYQYFGYNFVFERKSDNAVYCIHCAYTCLETSNVNVKLKEGINAKKMVVDNEIPKADDDGDEEEDQELERTDEEKIFYEKRLAKVKRLEMAQILKNDYNKIPNDGNRTCQCVNENFHFPVSKNLCNLSRVIRKSVFSNSGVNLNKFCYRIFDKDCALYRDITSEFIRKNIQIKRTIKENQPKEVEKLQKENTFTTEYLYHSKVIEAVCNYFKRANVNLESAFTKEVFNSMNFDFLLSLFSLNPRENDFLVIVKKQSLRIFRKFYLNPKINCKNFYSDQIDLNITPIHRKLTSRNISSDLFEDINIPKNDFLNFLTNVGANISGYFTDFYTPRFSRYLFKLYSEYLHILNMIIKYRIDDINFIQNNVKNIYDFLKGLINNQQNNKIYLIKKQILKLISKFLIKINDEKFFSYLEFDYNKNKINEKFDSINFCFENSELNNMIFKIFLMINQKTYSHKSRDTILNEQIQFFLDLMMIKEDGFSNNLDVIAKNKKFLIDFENFKGSINSVSDTDLKKVIIYINDQIDLATKLSYDLFTYKTDDVSISPEMSYAIKLRNQMQNINMEFEKSIRERSMKDVIFIQNFLFSNGYTTKMLHILINLRKISKTIPIEELKNVFVTIFNNLLLFTRENPFLALLLVTHKFTKILFYNEPEYNKNLFQFYIRIIKTLQAYSYKIDPTAFFDNFKTHFNKDNIFNVESTEKYEDLYHIGSFFDNLISVCNAKTRPVIFQTIAEQIKDIFSSKHFCDNVMKVVEKLKQDDLVSNLPDNDRFIIYAFKNFLKILNHVSDGHFVATISRIDTEVSSKLIESILSIKNVHPNLRRTLIGFYTKNQIQLPYKIHKSSEFNDELFQGMMENIPIMTADNEEGFGVEKQYEQLSVVTNELMIYHVNLEKYKDFFLIHKPAFFKYFAEAIFLPCVNSMYKISYFNDKLNSFFKYEIYKILVLFCKCFLYFLNKIDEYNFYDSKLFYDYLGIDIGLAYLSKEGDNNSLFENSESVFKLKEECKIIKNKLEADLTELDKDNFLIKDNNIFKKFIAYLKYYFLKDKILKNFNNFSEEEDEKNKGENIDENENSSENNKNFKFFSNYMEKISNFLNLYNERKRNKENLIFSRIFADEQTYKEVYLPKLNSQMTDFKVRSEFKKSLFLLLLDNMIDFDNSNAVLSYEYNEKNYYCLKKLVKIFKIDPSFCQSILLEERNRDNSKAILEEMIRKNLTCLFQIICVEYNTINSNEGKSTYMNILKIIEFIRLHCEDHNRIFQTYFCYFNIISPNQKTEGEDKDSSEVFYFIKFILKIFLLIYRFVIFKLRKKDILQFFGIKEIHFFDDLLKKIVEFLVEVYQGNYKENYNFLVGDSYEFGEFLDVFLKTFDDILNVTELEIIVMNFMTFYLSLLEDYDMTDENKNKITKKLNLKLILSTIIYCLKKCYNKYCLTEKENKDDGLTNPSNFLGEGSGDELLDVYKLKPEFSEDHLFKLLTKCYILLKILADLNNSKAIDVLNNLKEIYSNISNLKNNKNDRNYQNYIQKYEVYKFLSSIIKNVEINFARTKSSSIKDEKYLAEMNQKILSTIDAAEGNGNDQSEEEENSVIKPVNFLIHNDSLFLTEKDLELFKDKIPIDNYNNKLFELVSNISDIRNTIKFKKRVHGYNSKFIQFLSSLNYKYFEMISIFIVLVINLMMQWTMTSDEIAGTDPNHSSIIYLSIANLIFLGLIIINYMSFKFLSIDRDANPGLFYFLSYLFSNEIFALVWNFTIGVAATVSPYTNFLFSLQLFSIISLFETMKTILITIQLRWKQFTSTAILIVILIIFYTGISFYFIRNYYNLQDIQLNVCSNYIYCFFSIFSYGMRLGGGIGDLIGLVKYDDPLFWGLFIFQWVFYFSIVLIMLNVINGIIVDTFQDLREKNNKRKDIKDNECYICAINRIEFQINSLDFVAHKNDDHNFNNYILYLIKINEIDEHDLNSVDYQSLLCCRKKRTSFFPMKRSIALSNKKK